MSCGNSPALAQQAVTSATLDGRVEDEGGAAVSGATVVVINIITQSGTNRFGGRV
jgi:hypothetical protein